MGGGTKSETPVLRLGHVFAFTTFLFHTGVPFERYLRQQKLPILCDDPDVVVPLRLAWSFFAAGARGEDRMLGWHVGAHVGDHNLNAGLLRKLETAPTLYRALHSFVDLARTEASHIQLGIHERDDDILLYTHYAGMKDVDGYRTSLAYQIGIILDLVRHFLGKHWTPSEIGIEHSIDPTIAKEYFPGSRVKTNQPINYVAIPRDKLHRAVSCTSVKNGAVGGQIQRKNFDFIDTLRLLLKAYLADGYPSARFAASLMDISERSLARRLATRRLTYGKLIDEIRFSEAKNLLQQPGMRIEDVASYVGFVDHSNFTRMFRRVGGLTPKEFRKATQSE